MSLRMNRVALLAAMATLMLHAGAPPGFAEDTNETPGTVTCRIDRPVFVSQPEVNGRIVVKGQDNAVATVQCADLAFQEVFVIGGSLYFEWLPPGADPVDGWVRTSCCDYQRALYRGFGSMTFSNSQTFPADHPSQGEQHRACIKIDEPHFYEALCQEFPAIDPVGT